MNGSVPAISLAGLIWAFVPAVAVIAVLVRWTSAAPTAMYAMSRMLIQLLLIGYVLAYIFDAEHAGIILVVLALMLIAASAIAIRPLQARDGSTWARALIAIVAGGVPTLALVTQLALDVEPWFAPRFVVPLAGMVFASSMNAVSLAAERFASERRRAVGNAEARATALNAALIPLVNSLLAVGLVSLPGMMTGQVLSGVSPLVAARYQIVVMCMIFGASGISAAVYLALARRTAI